MSTTILKRTCFYSVIDGKIRPHEWALVNVAELGNMIEPFWPFAPSNASRSPFRVDDFTADMQRVDEFIQVDDNQLGTLLSGGGPTVLHGGRHYPRTGR